ncbi:MAG: hypothetical protein KDE53_23905, partial [Caldilineaceae bacterium]|nr:hypothetical protein [Caldilineaceae bacterium]
RLALAGDPANPGAASLTTSLDQFQSTIDQFLNQLSGLLTPVAAEIGAATTAAVNGINDFTAFVNGLDMPTLLEELRQKVEGILDALLPIDFAAITDPILQEIEENQTKLSEIDATSLNDLLREALAVALDVVISIDFTVEISNPLKEQFAQVKAVPQAALDQLQARYEAALGMLDALSPTQLLDALLSAFDIIEEAVSSIDVATLLQPLDELHEQYLVQPLDQLQPSVLLAPLSDAFQEFLAIFDTLDSSTLLAPVVDQLDALKTTVAAIDITGWIDDLLAAVADVQAQIAAIRPSELFAPLLADFERLEGELDRFKPSVVFAPVADLATPLLDLLETIQQETIDALFAIFQAPLAVLDRLQPDALTSHIQSQIDAVLAALRTVNFPARYNQLKASYFDFNAAVNAGGVEAKVELAGYVDPDDLLGEVAATYNLLIAALEGLKTNVAIPDLSDLYVQMRERLLSLLPPYAQQLLNPETFKRLLRLADPTRFLADLDVRFEAIKAKLLPIRPEEITGELDATYETVLGLVDGLQLDESLNQVKSELTRVQGIVNTLRVDFLAADIQHAIDEMQAVLAALDPTLLFADLDSLHAGLVQVVDGLKPSEVLAGLQTLLTQIQDLVNSVNPRTTLEPPLVAAWAAIEGILDEIDFTIVLSPLVDKLDEIEAEFEVSLG